MGTAEACRIVDAVVHKVKEYQAGVRDKSALVLFTKDTHGEEYLDTQEGKKLPVQHCIRGSEGHRLESRLEQLAVQMEAPVFEKAAFGSVELGQYLADLARREELEQIELAGLCTDICVISNAMLVKAFLPEVPVVVEAGCCAGVTPDSHRRALEAMQACQIQIVESIR